VIGAPFTSFSRTFGLSATVMKRRDKDKLKQPADKTSVVIGKRKASVYYPKEGVSDKTHPIHVKWSRPVSMETCNSEISGDVGGLDSLGLSKLDLKKPLHQLESSKALEAASPEVKRILSLEFARRRDVLAKLSSDLVKSIQRHPQDFTSIEVKIALLTVKIRNLQHNLIQQWPYKNQPLKHHLTHMVSLRRKNIGILRSKDYRKYEWLLEKLNLLYKPMPWDTPDGVVGEKENVARKASIERLTDLWCEELEKHRMTAYRNKLEDQQPEFLRKKAEKLKEVMEIEEKYGFEPTVTEDEVSECLRRAEEIEISWAKAKEIGEEEEDFLIYKEEVIKEENIYVR